MCQTGGVLEGIDFGQDRKQAIDRYPIGYEFVLGLKRIQVLSIPLQAYPCLCNHLAAGSGPSTHIALWVYFSCKANLYSAITILVLHVLPTWIAMNTPPSRKDLLQVMIQAHCERPFSIISCRYVISEYSSKFQYNIRFHNARKAQRSLFIRGVSEAAQCPKRA